MRRLESREREGERRRIRGWTDLGGWETGRAAAGGGARNSGARAWPRVGLSDAAWRWCRGVGKVEWGPGGVLVQC